MTLSLYREPLPKLKFERRRWTVAKQCPCGRSNRDGKFAPFVGYTDKGRCFSCGGKFLPDLPKKDDDWRKPVSRFPSLRQRKQETPISYIDPATIQATLGHYDQNHFMNYLSRLFTPPVAYQLAEDYHLGTSKHQFHRAGYPDYTSDRGAVIFWYVDTAGRTPTGKVMLYNSQTGERVKEPFDHITWAHAVQRLKNFNYRLCFFGEHLLTRYPEKNVCIVEGEKTAVIASVYYPQYNWLATGGASGSQLTNPETSKALAGKDVLLYPDLNKFDLWKEKAAILARNAPCRVSVSDLLESQGTEVEKKKGLDLADYLLRQQDPCGLALTDDGYPVIWDHPLPYCKQQNFYSHAPEKRTD